MTLLEETSMSILDEHSAFVAVAQLDEKVRKLRLAQASISFSSGEYGRGAGCEFGDVGKLASLFLSLRSCRWKRVKLTSDPSCYFSFLGDF